MLVIVKMQKNNDAIVSFAIPGQSQLIVNSLSIRSNDFSSLTGHNVLYCHLFKLMDAHHRLVKMGCIVIYY